MSFKKVLQVVLFTSSAYIGSVQASAINFDVDEINVELGNTVTLGLNLDFNSESVGGSFRLNYDASILANPIFNFDDDLATNYGIDTAIENHAVNGVVDFTIGTFSFAKGVEGTGLLGRLSFDTIAEGSAVLALGDIFGGFSDFNTFSSQTIQYQDTRIDVVSSVPLPAAAWLFVSGLGLLAVRKRLN